MPLLYHSNTRRTEIAVAFSGFAISFLGSLPLGTVNVLMVQLAASSGIKTALWFAAGCLVAELIYVRISLALRDLVIRFGFVQKILRWTSVFILIALAVVSFVAARSSTPRAMLDLPGEFSPFLFGFILMAINPVQLPFWFGWSTMLFGKSSDRSKRSDDYPVQYASYMTGIALGSIAGSLLFVLGGHFLLTSVRGSEGVVHLVIGGVYLVTALYLVWKGSRFPVSGSR